MQECRFNHLLVTGHLKIKKSDEAIIFPYCRFGMLPNMVIADGRDTAPILCVTLCGWIQFGSSMSSFFDLLLVTSSLSQ